MSQNNKFDLTETTIGAEPVAVSFNITGTDIADFIQKYLSVEGIKGAAVAVQAINTGTVNPKLGIIVSLNKNNAEIISNAGGEPGVDILPVFAQNVQTGGLRASEKLSEAIAPLSIEKKTKVYRSQKNKKYVYIPICPIKTISAMLKSIPNFSYINIVGVHRVKGEVVVSVFKQLRNATLGKTTGGGIYDESMNRHFQ